MSNPPSDAGESKLTSNERKKEATKARKRAYYMANKEAIRERNRKSYERSKYLKALGLEALKATGKPGASTGASDDGN